MTKRPHQLSSIEQEILSDIQSGSGLTDAFAPLMKRVMEAALQGELTITLKKKHRPEIIAMGHPVKQ